jgi:hypothetical protein
MSLKEAVDEYLEICSEISALKVKLDFLKYKKNRALSDLRFERRKNDKE